MGKLYNELNPDTMYYNLHCKYINYLNSRFITYFTMNPRPLSTKINVTFKPRYVKFNF